MLLTRRARIAWRVLLPALVMAGIAGAAQGGSRQVFSTWDDFEVDKLAAIWLIERHIAPGAQVLIFPHGQEIDQGVPFDTPYATFKRGFSQSAFESLVSHFRLDDPRILRMGRIVHDIEINVWEKKAWKKSAEVQIRIADLLSRSRDRASLLKESGDFFDELYRQLSQDPEPNP